MGRKDPSRNYTNRSTTIDERNKPRRVAWGNIHVVLAWFSRGSQLAIEEGYDFTPRAPASSTIHRAPIAHP